MEYLLSAIAIIFIRDYFTERMRAKNNYDLNKLNHDGGEKARIADVDFVKANTANLHAQRDLLMIRESMYDKGYFDEGAAV